MLSEAESLELLELLEGSESPGLSSVPVGGILPSPFPPPSVVSLIVLSLFSGCAGGSSSFVFSFSFVFSGIFSTSGLSDGSGASNRLDRRSEYLPSGSFPFLSSYLSFWDSWIVS